MTSRVNGPDNFLVVVGFLFQYVHYHSNHLYTSLTTEAIALHFDQNCKDAVTCSNKIFFEKLNQHSGSLDKMRPLKVHGLTNFLLNNINNLPCSSRESMRSRDRTKDSSVSLCMDILHSDSLRDGYSVDVGVQADRSVLLLG